MNGLAGLWLICRWFGWFLGGLWVDWLVFGWFRVLQLMMSKWDFKVAKKLSKLQRNFTEITLQHVFEIKNVSRELSIIKPILCKYIAFLAK